jgi:hypothetical protein
MCWTQSLWTQSLKMCWKGEELGVTAAAAAAAAASLQKGQAGVEGGSDLACIALQQQQQQQPYIVHNNCIIGHKAKIDRFKAFGLWAVPPQWTDWEASPPTSVPQELLLPLLLPEALAYCPVLPALASSSSSSSAWHGPPHPAAATAAAPVPPRGGVKCSAGVACCTTTTTCCCRRPVRLRLTGHLQFILCVSFGSSNAHGAQGRRGDGRRLPMVYTTSQDKTVRCWELQLGAETEPAASLPLAAHSLPCSLGRPAAAAAAASPEALGLLAPSASEEAPADELLPDPEGKERTVERTGALHTGALEAQLVDVGQGIHTHGWGVWCMQVLEEAGSAAPPLVFTGAHDCKPRVWALPPPKPAAEGVGAASGPGAAGNEGESGLGGGAASSSNDQVRKVLTTVPLALPSHCCLRLTMYLYLRCPYLYLRCPGSAYSTTRGTGQVWLLSK